MLAPLVLVALHSVGLAGASLTIDEDSGVEALRNPFNEGWDVCLGVNVSLDGLVREDVVKTEGLVGLRPIIKDSKIS